MVHVYDLGIKVGENVHNALERWEGIHVDSGISGCSSKFMISPMDLMLIKGLIPIQRTYWMLLLSNIQDYPRR